MISSANARRTDIRSRRRRRAPQNRTARAFGYTTCKLPRRTRARDALLELCHTTPFGFSWPEGLLCRYKRGDGFGLLVSELLLRVVWRGRDGRSSGGRRFGEGAIRQAR